MVKSKILWMAMLLSACGHTQDKVTEWKEDIDFYAEKMVSNHIDPFHSISRSHFNEEILRIKNDLPNKTENETLMALMRLTRSLGDGHTSFPLWGAKDARFPIEVKLFGNTLYVVGTTRQYKDILGAKLVSVNDVPASKIFGLLSEISPFSENEHSTAVRAASYLSSAIALNGLGITENANEAKFAFEVQGKTREIKLLSSSSLKLDETLSHLKDAIFTAANKVNDDLWYGSLPDKKTVYIKFRRYPSMQKMDGFAQSLLDFINENKSENLIIDLRDNYGGDFFVGLKLAQRLVLADSIKWKTGVYTLIDGVTFSAAMSNAAQYTQILNSKLVGMPTGAKPSGYQDMGQFKLPHSGLEVTFSKRLYHFKETKRDAVYPDALVEISIEDCLNSYDRQLRWVLNEINHKRMGNKAL